MADPPLVFLSYSHDSEPHAARVLALADRLRADGVDCVLDQYFEFGPPEGWPRWMERQVEEADFVVVVVSEGYLRRAAAPGGKGKGGGGLGVKYESRLLIQELYEAGMVNEKFIPVLFGDATVESIPRPLRPYNYYRLDREGGYEALYRRLTGQPRTVMPEIGAIHPLPARNPAAPSPVPPPLPERPPLERLSPEPPASEAPAPAAGARRRSRRRIAAWIALGAALLALAAWLLARRPNEDLLLPSYIREILHSRQAPQPADPEAARLYREGVRKLAQFNATAARADLQESLRHEASPLTYTMLAEALLKLGMTDRAAASANEALRRAGGLPAGPRLAVEARCRMIVGEWDLAIAAYRKLPKSTENRLAIAQAQIAAGRSEEALKALREEGDDPQVELVRASAEASLPDFPAMRRTARKACEEAKRRGNDQIAAQALFYEGYAEYHLGSPRAAFPRFQEAQELFRRVSDDRRVAQVQNAIANMNRELGELQLAQGEYGEALATYRALGDQAGEANQLDALAQIALALGDVREALRLSEEALGIFRELRNTQRGAARTSFTLGGALVLAGDLAGAEKAFERSLALCPGDPSLAAEARSNLGDVYAARGEIERAREAYSSAVALWHDLRQEGEANYGKLDLGRLLLADEPPRFEQAEGYLKDALAQFRQEGQADKEAEAQAVLARIYAGQRAARKNAMALSRAALAEADRLAAKSENRLLQITVLLAEAEVRRAAGEAPQALELLRKARAEAESRQLVPLALEAREELGGIELCCGDRRRGEELLRAVGTDARERGFLQVARRAAKLLAPPNSSFPGP